ncbi:MAG: hypothetical protein U1G05_17455 [Kiritimatiellia bacterium]
MDADARLRAVFALAGVLELAVHQLVQAGGLVTDLDRFVRADQVISSRNVHGFLRREIVDLHHLGQIIGIPAAALAADLEFGRGNRRGGGSSGMTGAGRHPQGQLDLAVLDLRSFSLARSASEDLVEALLQQAERPFELRDAGVLALGSSRSSSFRPEGGRRSYDNNSKTTCLSRAFGQ